MGKSNSQMSFDLSPGSLRGLFIGFLLITIAIPLLWINEGQAIQIYRGPGRGLDLVESIDPHIPDPSLDGHLVTFQGTVLPGGVIQDPILGVSTSGALCLLRSVEMFQWLEEKLPVDSGKEKSVVSARYRYRKEWSASRIFSDRFVQKTGHENPVMPLETAYLFPPSLKVGAFDIPGNLISRVSGLVPMSENELTFDSEVVFHGNSPTRSGAYIYFGNPDSPSVGDLRIRYSLLREARVSILARQSGNTVEPYETRNGVIFYSIERGEKTPEQLIDQKQDRHRFRTLGLRVMTLILMFTGFIFLLNSRTTRELIQPLADRLKDWYVIPGSFLLASFFFLLTYAFSWIVVTTIYSIFLIGVAILILTAGFLLLRKP